MRLFLCLAIFLGMPAFAAIPEVMSYEGTVASWLKKGRDDGSDFFAHASGIVDLKRHLVNDNFHAWEAMVFGDVSFFNYAKWFMWHSSLAVDTLADQKNEIFFRLVQVYYDIFTSFDFNTGYGVVYAGYRHRCSHGADAAEPSRIPIRSGPELGYRYIATWSQVDFAASLWGFYTVFGQNTDLAFAPRVLVAATVEATWRFLPYLGAFVSGGLGGVLVGTLTDSFYSAQTPMGQLDYRLLPKTGLGVSILGSMVDARVGLEYQRIMDSGLGLKTNQVDTLALDIGFRF